MVHVLFEIQTLMPTILFIDKNHGKTSTPKSEGSCIFRGTVDRCIGQHLGRQSINILAAMLADTRSRVCQISAEYRPISRSSGVLLSLTYWSTDRSTVGRDSISSVSTIYWWIVSEYQWGISGVSVNNQHRLESVNISTEWCFTVGRVSVNKSTNSQPW